MFVLAIIVGLVWVGFRILKEGQIPIFGRWVATGWSAKLAGWALVMAGPVAYGVEYALIALQNRTGNALGRSPLEQREALFFWVLFLVPALFIAIAILASLAPSKSSLSAQKDGP
jgi:hypothetical protein